MVKNNKKKSHPTFYVPNSKGKRRMKSVKTRWRKPTGVDNKKRIRKKYMGACPRIGYKNPDSIRGRHPSGLEEVLVFNLKDLEGLKDKAIRISGSVGKKKKILLVSKAKEIGLAVINEVIR